MTVRRCVVLALMILCLGSLALAQDEELPLATWGAPPYWTPPPVKQLGSKAAGGMVAQAQGMTARAAALPSAPLPFVAITPCRIVDTRITDTDGFHSPNFIDDETRTFPFPSSPDCPGLPSTAGAFSVNVQLRTISQLGFLTLFPTGASRPGVSTLVGNPASWTTNAAVVPAGTAGQIDVYCQYAARVVIDINGYYGPQSVVTSAFGRSGDVTAVGGDYTAALVTNTPAGTISATDVQAAIDQLDNSKAAFSHTHTGASITGLISGGVLFGNSSGNIGQNASQLSWDQANSRLGIGTATPSQQLELTGMMKMPATVATSGTPTAGVIYVGSYPFIHNYGSQNTFLGRSGNFSMTGFNNTATGADSLGATTTGYYNTASGGGSLQNNTTGVQNTASGAVSLSLNTEGSHNTAMGTFSLRDNTTGSYNTAIGMDGLLHSTSGSRNIALGYDAGVNLTVGDYNIDIGNAGEAGEGSTIRIGTDGYQTSTFIAGIRGRGTGVANAVAVLIDSNGQLATASSSIRFKQDVADMGDASSRLMDLRPVTFRYKSHPVGPLQYGLIAEEVEAAMPELVVKDATGQPETVAYHELPAMLLNELQKQQATIQRQQAEIDELHRQVQVLLATREAAKPVEPVRN
jgi:hypothetical protein